MSCAGHDDGLAESMECLVRGAHRTSAVYAGCMEKSGSAGFVALGGGAQHGGLTVIDLSPLLWRFGRAMGLGRSWRGGLGGFFAVGALAPGGGGGWRVGSSRAIGWVCVFRHQRQRGLERCTGRGSGSGSAGVLVSAAHRFGCRLVQDVARHGGRRDECLSPGTFDRHTVGPGSLGAWEAGGERSGAVFQRRAGVEAGFAALFRGAAALL